MLFPRYRNYEQSKQNCSRISAPRREVLSPRSPLYDRNVSAKRLPDRLICCNEHQTSSVANDSVGGKFPQLKNVVSCKYAVNIERFLSRRVATRRDDDTNERSKQGSNDHSDRALAHNNKQVS